MGSGVGVFTDNEVKDLDDEDRKRLKEQIVHHLQTSEDIRRIVSEKPNLLPDFLASHTEIRDKLQEKARPLLERLKKK